MGIKTVTVDVGYDRFTFDLVLAKAKTLGLKVWPLQMDENGLAPGLPALAPHKILVRATDEQALRSVIEQIIPSAPVEHKPMSRIERFLHRLLG